MKMKQNPSIPSKVRAEHLNRAALVYVRQSTMAQVRFNQESTQRQYALQERALSLGWPEEHIRVIDGDLRNIWFRKIQTPWLCPTRDKRIPGRSRRSVRAGDIPSCPVISRPNGNSLNCVDCLAPS